MTNLEQTVERSFFGQVKNYVGRVRNSVVGRIAVYSLAGVLGGGIGYGCEGDAGSNGTNSPNSSAARYACVNNQCVENPNGLYAIPNCDNTCVKETELFCWEKIIGESDSGGELYSIQQTSDGGYIAAGFNLLPTDIYNLDAWILKLDVEGNLIWDKTFGGMGYDEAHSIKQTNDGNYIAAGISKGAEVKDAVIFDAWILKLDVEGNLIWDKTFGESGDDWANSIQQTNDLGYIVAGYTKSKGVGDKNAWIIKLDPKGEIEWDKTFGEQSKDSSANSIQQTTDGEYIIAGTLESKSEYYSDNDAWVFKLDATGNVIWNTTFGESDQEEIFSIQQTNDGKYIIAGYTDSKGAGGQDAWVLKLDTDGHIIWDKTFGGSENDYVHSIQPTNDEGYIVAGYTTSKSTGGEDTWVLKLDSKGEMKWDKTFEGNYNDRAESIQQTTDGGYVVAGYTNETLIVGGQKVGGQHLGVALILKLDSLGNLECE